MAEAGISFGLPVLPSVFEVGISLKEIVALTFYEEISLARAEEKDLEDAIREDFKDNRKRSLRFNMDLGARVMPLSWLTAALSVRNAIPMTFDFSGPGGDVDVDPQVRVAFNVRPAGIFQAGVDFDLLENDSDLLPGYTWRYVAVGAELDLTVLKIRAGFSDNLAESTDKPSVAAGFGFRIGPVMLDLGAQVAFRRTEARPESLDGKDDALNVPSRAGFSLTLGVDTTF